MEFVGRAVRKEFDGFGFFSGTVKSYDSATGLFEILYEDGDSEELELFEITALLDENGDIYYQSGDAEMIKKPSRVGRRPKKRRHRFMHSDSGNTSGGLIGDSCSNQSCEKIETGYDVGFEGFEKNFEVEAGAVDDRNGNGCVNVKLNRNDVFDLNHGLNLNLSVVDLNHGMNLNDVVDLNQGLNFDDEVNLNDVVDSNMPGDLMRKDFIDLNMDANDYENGNLEQDDSGILRSETLNRGPLFDLNLGLDDGIKDMNLDCHGQLKDNAFSLTSGDNRFLSSNGSLKVVNIGTIEGDSIDGFACSTENLMGDGIQKEDSFIVSSSKKVGCGAADANFVNGGNSFLPKFNFPTDACSLEMNESEANSILHKGSNSRKRRKLSDAVNSTTETVLRRSARRGTATFSAQNDVSRKTEFNIVDDQLSSPALSAVSEEKTTYAGHEETEEHSVLPAKSQLPPSSGNLNVDGIPILDLFSVYSFLRSFSTLLFLSPFELEDFVAALRYEAPNLLFDSIHVSLLQIMQKHLESISDENLQSSNCLRSLNWDWLDLITWPVFMVEYLLVRGSQFKPDFICYMKLFEGDYYKQPAAVKIEILRCLCDEVIEVEAIRSELNKRKLATVSNMDYDRNFRNETSKRRRAMMDIAAGSCLTEEVIDETADWNSDDCCLCKMDGNLICCDGCPAAFHSRCVGVVSSCLPEGNWYCPECVIDKNNPWTNVGRAVRGAELLGIDPHGRLYYFSSGYLLVSDSCDSLLSFSYYHLNDFTVVMEAVKASGILYSSILSSIDKHWKLPAKVKGPTSDLDLQTVSVCSDFLMNGQMSIAPLLSAPSEIGASNEHEYGGKIGEKPVIPRCSDNVGPEPSFVAAVSGLTNCATKMENPLACSEGSAETSQAITDFQKSAAVSSDLKINREAVSVGTCSLTSMNLKAEQGKDVQSSVRGHVSPVISTQRGMPEGHRGTVYVNYYSLARTASSVVEELAHKSLEKISEDSIGLAEDIIFAQLKAISNNSSVLCWPNIQNLYIDARKEKCGWCFSCKFPEGENDCLFIMQDASPVLERYTSDILGLRSRKNWNGHLIDVICQILCIENRLHGFLSGPWLNPHYSKLWHKSVVRASCIASVKHLLLKLESNLHRLALSAEWVKYVDSVATMGSASHVVTSSQRVSAKNGIAKRRARCSDVEPHPSLNATSGLGLFWWRGGRLSRQVFSWKVLPRALACKAGRQAGCRKIPGILYPESSEFAKRSKYVAWRAAVETSSSVAQLALQVRELNANIRWVDIENTNTLSRTDKESKKSLRSFKKVIIRRKCIVGTAVKYLLDFGKRRFIPDIVLRHGSMLEESSGGRKRYWLEECYVPLHLLKGFEEKRIACKSRKMNSAKLQDNGSVTKKLSRKCGFSHLFLKVERSDYYQCGRCNRDVLIRDAVSCQYCQGFFHKRHVRKSGGGINAESTYTCLKCQDGICMKTVVMKGKLQLQRSKKAARVLRSVRSRICKTSGKGKKPAESQNNRNGTVVVPLRRSPRKIKFRPLKGQEVGRINNKGKKTKCKKSTSKQRTKGSWQKKRTPVNHTYWLNGLRLSTKPNDERVSNFHSQKVIDSIEQLIAIADQPKCRICCAAELTSTSNYICCEVCGDWFHGVAFGLGAENMSKLIGFKCHKCRDRAPPVCPYLYKIRDGKAQLGGSENNAKIECAEEVSSGILFPNEIYVKSHSDDELTSQLVTNGYNHKEQHPEISPGLDQGLKSDD